jgi:hypothetical protein
MDDHGVGCGGDVRSAWGGIAECCFHRGMCLNALCDMRFCFLVLVLRCSITGTLDPLRNLTRLVDVRLSTNSIGGMFMRTAVLEWLCWSVDVRLVGYHAAQRCIDKCCSMLITADRTIWCFIC